MSYSVASRSQRWSSLSGASRQFPTTSDATAPPCFPYSPHVRTELGHRSRTAILFQFLSAVGGRFLCLPKQNAVLRKTSAEGIQLLFSASLSPLCGLRTRASSVSQGNRHPPYAVWRDRISGGDVLSGDDASLGSSPLTLAGIADQTTE